MMSFMQPRDRLIVALDYSARSEILEAVDVLQGVAGVFKIGLQAFMANGPSIVREVVDRGEKVFLDLKIHDIPNTTSRAVAEAAGLGAEMVTVHAAGGIAMLEACAGSPLLVLGVTVLTSLDAGELEAVGMEGSPVEAAVRLARLAHAAGIGGVVASPHEIAPIRETCGTSLVVVTPGIRPAGAERGDQRRTMTPRDAIQAGADYLVVGRPITGAAAPREAALRILEEMDV